MPRSEGGRPSGERREKSCNDPDKVLMVGIQELEEHESEDYKRTGDKGGCKESLVVSSRIFDLLIAIWI